MRSRAVEDARPVDIDLVVVICNEKLPWLSSFFAPPNLAPSVQVHRRGERSSGTQGRHGRGYGSPTESFLKL